MTRPRDPFIRDPGATPGESEYSFGPGLTPKGLEHAPPDQGGRYHGKTPPEVFNPLPNIPYEY